MKYAMGLKNVQYAISNDTAVRLLDFVEHPNQPTPTNEDGVVALTRRARGIARRRATRDARATLSRGETRRSEKFARRETARARTRRDRATDARENVNRVAHPGDGSRRASRRRFAASRACFRLATRGERCARGVARRNASI